MKSLLVILMMSSLTIVACKNSVPTATKSEIAVALEKPNVLILDVRTASEFASGHVEGAVNLPVDDISGIESLLADKERQIVVHCASGGRSAKATARLTEMGYTKVFDAKTPQAVADAMGKDLVK